MILAHKIALDPTVKQRIALAKACGVARFTWNWALATAARRPRNHAGSKQELNRGYTHVYSQIREQKHGRT